jgi:hypothetical protein
VNKMGNFFSIQQRLRMVMLASTTALALMASPIFVTDGNAAQGAGKQSGKGSQSVAVKGAGQQKGKSGKSLSGIFRDVTGASSEDSDRPDHAGVKGGKDGAGGGQPATSGSKKGDLFGDLFVILRDDQGIPILTPEGWVQPLDADGNIIPLDDEGHPVDETLTVEVELGRLNVGRAPTSVLDRRADEVVTLLNQATEVSLDPAGRLVLTVDGVEKTIDSPLENLAIYVALMTDGSIPGVTLLPTVSGFDFLVDDMITTADLTAAASFLAAATDKTGAFSTDEIAYIDAFLGINLKTTGTQTYSVVDYSTFTYDRSDTYSGVTADVLIQQPDGSWVPTTINVYDVVFDNIDVTNAGTLEAFTQAAEDSRVVIEYIHEFALPDPSVATN